MALKWLQDIEKGTKAAAAKRRIISYYLRNKASTIPDLTREMDLSTPTVAKFLSELSDDGVVVSYGKLETGEGRPPALYGLKADAGYFLGVDIKKFTLDIALMNLTGDTVKQAYDIPCQLENTEKGLDTLCGHILSFIEKEEVPEEKLLHICINISGRVNSVKGYSYSLFKFDERPLSEVLSERLGYRTCIDNDTRAMTYGEMVKGAVRDEQDIIFINLSWGLGAGLIFNGEIYMGKSGFSGEFGHFNVFDNEIICHCGKRGCLETEVSGASLYRNLLLKVKEGKQSILSAPIEQGTPITLNDIVNAINREDVVCIELMGEIGQKLGRYLAGLINVLNPELVIIGGVLARTGDYLLQPVITAIRKYSLNLVNRDTVIKLSELGSRCGVIGACMLARKRLFEEC